jgi:hypothetical protein
MLIALQESEPAREVLDRHAAGIGCADAAPWVRNPLGSVHARERDRAIELGANQPTKPEKPELTEPM